jgi:hypothetical protein
MRERVYVDRLFADYEDNLEIMDFKEEITANLIERVRGLTTKGLGEEQAFDRATAELGDITAIANDLGKKRKKEAIGQMYMKSSVPLAKRTAAGLTSATGVLLIAAGIALISLFNEPAGIDVSASVPFYFISAILFSLACGLYTFFGLSQETVSHYPMTKRRALMYGKFCMVGFLGTGLAVVSYFVVGVDLGVAITIKAVFIIPAICALVYLLTTEPDRKKPWLKAMVEKEHEKALDMVDPIRAARFGVASGGLWILAIAVFVTIGFVGSWQFAWLVFPFALAFQVFMVATIFDKRK